MNANGTRISALTRDLWLRWQETKDHWRDLKAAEFENKYMADLLPTVDKTVAAIEQVDKMLTRIKKDCE